MKKVLLVTMALLIVFALSGCNTLDDIYYTKEEIDQKIEEHGVQRDNPVFELCEYLSEDGLRNIEDCRDGLTWFIENWELTNDTFYYVDWEEELVILTQDEYNDIMRRIEALEGS